MAQFYQITSLEELRRIYPNLQFDNVEGIQCMIQDEQITQYSDSQGQQVIATVEPANIQVSQNVVASTQCGPQQSQFVVHQPTQFVIQHIDEPRNDTVQYIQHTQNMQNKGEDACEFQLADQSVGCFKTNVSHEKHALQQCLMSNETNQQFISQVQPIMQQPLQIHKQIQAVDVGTNILVLQNQNQELGMTLNKSELINSSPEKQQQIIIQKAALQSPQQSLVHTQPMIHKNENPAQNFEQHQILHGVTTSQTENQTQILHHAEQQIAQQLQYYNQVTVIDGLQQPKLAIEHCEVGNERMMLQQQQQKHQQLTTAATFQQKKVIPDMPPLIQQPQQLIIPQTLEMTPPPALASRIPQCKKKEQEVEAQTGPVFIVQKLESPLFIKQPQTKIRFHSPVISTEKPEEKNIFQTVAKPLEKIRNIVQENHESLQSQSQMEIQGKKSFEKTDLQSAISKLSVERCQSILQMKIEHSNSNRLLEQEQKSKHTATIFNKSNVKMKIAEQQTDEEKETKVRKFEKYVGNATSQTESHTTPSNFQPHIQLSISPLQVQTTTNQGIGRGSRGGSNINIPRAVSQYAPRARAVQVQTSPPRLSSIERNTYGRGVKSATAGRGGGGGTPPCGVDQRRPSTTQIIRTNTPTTEANQISNEVVEEATLLVLLINGEKKLIKIPCSHHNIHLGQIVQQVGATLSSPTSIAIEQVLDVSNSNQYTIKNVIPNSQQSLNSKASHLRQCAPISNSMGTPRNIVTTQQQRFRGPSPRIPHSSNVRHRLHFLTPKLNTSQDIQTSNANLEIPQATATQPIHTISAISTTVKEEPRFVSGYMAICPFCGIQSLDFNKCIRCRRKLPENVKSQSIFDIRKKKLDKATEDKVSDEKKGETDEKQFDGEEAKKKAVALQSYEKKKVKPFFKKKKINDEPTEILILSSDDEEDSKSKKTELTKSVPTILRKEPIYAISELSEGDMNNVIKESTVNEDLMKNIQPGSFTTLQCKTLRVGSYKVQPKERVLISNKGIRLVINSLKNENVMVVIPIVDIVKALIHFGKQVSVIFIYPKPKVGIQIRNVLGMSDKMGPYYDPTSSEEETHKRITLMLEKITEDNKILLYKIFEPDKIEELSEKEANEILLRASPLETQNAGLSRPLDLVRKILVYPPPPEKGGITLNNQDYACLGEDQFLNDVIIDFYLKYLMLKVLSPEDRNRTHVFSTFFYKRLTTKPKAVRKNDPENDPKLSPAEKRHMRVKGWTKQVNLFEKDFVIVPINEHSHWFLAIICFPGLSGPVRFSDNTPVELDEVVPKRNVQTLQIGNTTITHIIKASGNTISLEMDCGSDRDEAEGDQEDLHPSSDDEDTEQGEEECASNSSAVQIPLLAPLTPNSSKDSKMKLLKRKPCREPIKQPCILIFDSLAGASRARVVATLRDYLKIEFKKKMGEEKDFSKDTIKGAVPKVPQQNNFTDCGLYVLQYVESFFQDPLHDFKLPLKYLQEWFSEEVVSCKRQKLASLIRCLMEEQGIKVEEMGLPVLNFTNGNVDNQAKLGEEEEEDDEGEEEEEEEEELDEAGVELKSQVHLTEAYDQDEEEDMDLVEEEEDEEEMECEENEEVEIGDVSVGWVAATKRRYNELESSMQQVECPLIKSSPLVDYEDSESEEESFLNSSRGSDVLDKIQVSISDGADEEYCESELSLSMGSKESLSMAESANSSSRMTCRTIQRNPDNEISDSGANVCVIGKTGSATSQENTPLQTTGVSNSVAVFSGVTQNVSSSLERIHLQPSEMLMIARKPMEVTDIIKKLVSDKNITVSKKEEEINSHILKKQIEIRRFKAKDCDKNDDVEKESTRCEVQKNSIAAQKRTYQALKSVRIPKKAERNLEFAEKRQKLGET